MFVISLSYPKESEKADELLSEHNDFLQKYYENGMFICSGPKIPPTGGIIFCRSNSLKEVDKLLEDDPYKVNGVADYEITEFKVADCLPEFEVFL